MNGPWLRIRQRPRMNASSAPLLRVGWRWLRVRNESRISPECLCAAVQKIRGINRPAATAPGLTAHNRSRHFVSFQAAIFQPRRIAVAVKQGTPATLSGGTGFRSAKPRFLLPATVNAVSQSSASPYPNRPWLRCAHDNQRPNFCRRSSKSAFPCGFRLAVHPFSKIPCWNQSSLHDSDRHLVLIRARIDPAPACPSPASHHAFTKQPPLPSTTRWRMASRFASAQICGCLAFFNAHFAISKITRHAVLHRLVAEQYPFATATSFPGRIESQAWRLKEK